MLEQASESFKIQLLRDDENGDEVLSIDKIQADQSPIIRLVDSTVFDALNRRASDIHIETRDSEVVIKYRIDGVLQPAMKPIAKEHHSTIISRIKVMSELDIAEKRVPQDGRFRVKIGGRSIDFRVSIMPSVHGEDAVIRILDKESLSKQFASLRLDVLGFDEKELARFRRFIREPYGMVLVTGPDRLRQDHDALRGALRDQDRGRQDHHDRGPGRVPAQGASRRSRSTRRRGSPSRAGCARSCATTPTRSWWGRSATPRRPTSRSSRRSPATSSSRPSTPTT